MNETERERELRELMETVERFTAFARSSLDQYNETAEMNHLSGVSNSLILIYEAIRQTLKQP